MQGLHCMQICTSGGQLSACGQQRGAPGAVGPLAYGNFAVPQRAGPAEPFQPFLEF